MTLFGKRSFYSYLQTLKCFSFFFLTSMFQSLNLPVWAPEVTSNLSSLSPCCRALEDGVQELSSGAKSRVGTVLDFCPDALWPWGREGAQQSDSLTNWVFGCQKGLDLRFRATWRPWFEAPGRTEWACSIDFGSILQSNKILLNLNTVI